MKTIVVAVDFTAVSENAAFYAAKLALDVHADLVLFHTYQYPVITGEITLPPQIFQDVIDSASSSIEALAARLSNELNGKQVVRTELREGSFTNELRDYCETCQPYLVLLGSSGITASGRFFFGSQALTAIKRLQWPLMIIPPRAKYKGIHFVGLASDLEDVKNRLPVSKIAGFVNAFHAKLYVGYVMSENGFEPEKRMEGIKIRELFEMNSVEMHYIGNKEFEAGIDKFCSDFSIDLLIMVPHKHSFFERILHISHTVQILKDSFSPMLFLKK